jgi:hypothetical protein
VPQKGNTLKVGLESLNAIRLAVARDEHDPFSIGPKSLGWKFNIEGCCQHNFQVRCNCTGELHVVPVYSVSVCNMAHCSFNLSPTDPKIA